MEKNQTEKNQTEESSINQADVLEVDESYKYMKYDPYLIPTEYQEMDEGIGIFEFLHIIYEYFWREKKPDDMRFNADPFEQKH